MTEQGYDQTAIEFWNYLRKEERVDVIKIRDHVELLQYLETTRLSGWANFVQSEKGWDAVESNRPRYKWSDEEVDILRGYYEQGLSTKDIVSMAGGDLARTPGAIRTKFYRVYKEF